MKRLVWLILLIPLTGCDAWKKLTGTNDTNVKSQESLSHKGIAIYVMVGHSNMLSRAIQSSSYSPKPNIVMFGTYGWVVAKEPTGFLMDSLAGTSSGVAFANALDASNPGHQIGLINCAQGGSTTSQWQPGYPLFDQCAERLSRAMQDGYLAGILVWTGENDCDGVHEVDWENPFMNLVNGFRKVAYDPNVPVAYVLVSSSYPSDLCTASRLRIIEQEFHHPGICSVDSDGFPTEDGSHINTVAQEMLGVKFANLFQIKETK